MEEQKKKKPQTSAHKGEPGWREREKACGTEDSEELPSQAAPFLSGQTNSGPSVSKSEMGGNRRFEAL